MIKGKVSSTPGVTSRKPDDDQNPLLNSDHHSLYRAAVGKLLWTVSERPDLAFSVKELARACQSPRLDDWRKLEHTLRYLSLIHI